MLDQAASIEGNEDHISNEGDHRRLKVTNGHHQQQQQLGQSMIQQSPAPFTVETKKKKASSTQKAAAANQNINRMLAVYMKNPDVLAEEERQIKARLLKKRKAEEAERERLIQKQLQEREQQAIQAMQAIAQSNLGVVQDVSKKEKKKKKKQKDKIIEEGGVSGTSSLTEQLIELERKKHQMNEEILNNAARFPAASSVNGKRADPPKNPVHKNLKIYRISDPQPVRDSQQTRSARLLNLKEQQSFHSKSQESTQSLMTTVECNNQSAPTIDSKNKSSIDNKSIVVVAEDNNTFKQSQQTIVPSKQLSETSSRYFLSQPQSRNSASSASDFMKETIVETQEMHKENQNQTPIMRLKAAGKIPLEQQQQQTLIEDKSQNVNTKLKLLNTLKTTSAKEENENGQGGLTQNIKKNEQNQQQSNQIKVNSRLTQSTEASKLKIKAIRSPSATPAVSVPAPAVNVNGDIFERQRAYLEKIKEANKLEKEAEEEKKQRENQAREKLKKTVLAEVRQTLKDEETANQIAQRQQMMTSTFQKEPAAIQPKRRASFTLQPVHKMENDNDNQNDDNNNNMPGPGRRTRAMPGVKNLEEWKKKQRLPEATKVFIIKGGYGDLKRALLNRGWVENPQADSPCFNFKFTLMGKDINYDEIEPFQIVNHFEKNFHLSTKAGLVQSLRNLPWTISKDSSVFFPECFYLNEPDDMTHFVNTFKLAKALSILKKFIRVSKENTITLDTFSCPVSKKNKKKEPTQSLSNEITTLRVRAYLALAVLAYHSQDIHDIIDEGKAALQYFNSINDEDWKTLTSDEVTVEQLSLKMKQSNWLEKIKQYITKQQQQVTEQKSQMQSQLKKQPSSSSSSSTQLSTESTIALPKTTIPLNESFKEDSELISLANMYCQRQKGIDPQFDLKGEDNIWILKPAGLSRGRGITCHSDLDEIQEMIKQSEVQMHLVVQKYIENPLLVHSRKFDIRAWVVITEWNPMQIWYFDDCYVRFSADDYSTDNLSNAFQHLTNNAISKNKKNDDNSDNVHPITKQGNMYTQKQLEDFLTEKEGYNVFQQKIKPAMLEVIQTAVLGCSDVEPRKNSFELFGFDVMIDENYTPWLLEANTSPCMEYSTEITENLVKAVFEDLPKVVLDHKRSFNSPAAAVTVDTGKFIRIYSGQEISTKSNGMIATQLICEGTKARISRKQPQVKEIVEQNISIPAPPTPTLNQNTDQPILPANNL